MSCHNIGRGMATVVDHIMEEYHNQNIDLDCAKRLIRECMNGVNWCDGNEDEAIQTIIDNTCSCCLKQMTPEVDILYDTFDLDRSFPDMNKLAGYYVCENCLEKLINAQEKQYSLEEAKEKCEKKTAGWYFKLRDCFEIKFGKKSFEQTCREYGYK